MKRILIVGGAGFIGFPLAKRLISEGYDVKIFDDFSNPAKNYFNASLPIIQGDITNRDGITECVRDTESDIIIHLAAWHYIPSCTKDPIKTKEINVIGTKNILDAIKDFSRNTYFIFASSAAVYIPGKKAHAETSETGPLEIYGKTKVEAENLIKEYSDSWGIESFYKTRNFI